MVNGTARVEQRRRGREALDVVVVHLLYALLSQYVRAVVVPGARERGRAVLVLAAQELRGRREGGR